MTSHDRNEHHQSRIGFIGAGNMAEAMISSLIRADRFLPENIFAHDMLPERLDYLCGTYQITCVADLEPIIGSCDIVVLAVKPQQMTELLDGISRMEVLGDPARRCIFISIAAGVRIATFEKYIYANRSGLECQRMPIIRVMPNTPALAGAGMCAFSGNAHATGSDIDLTRRILEVMGDVLQCDESKMDAVTAMSGSGPAYCFYFMEAMTEAGVRLGLSEDEALRLTLATFRGAVRLMETGDESAASFRKKVTSPGGTTEAAIRVFDENRLTDILISAIFSAAKRSAELSGDQS